MKLCELIFDDSPIIEVNSVKMLEDALLSIRAGFKPSNPLIVAAHLNGNSMGLGISSRGCYINFIDSSKLPPYYSSVGDRNLTPNDGVVEFQLSPHGHTSEILCRHIIAFEELLRVAKEFYKTGARPVSLIEWEVD